MKLRSRGKECFVEALSSIDSFGINYSFLVNGNEKLKTASGAMITIIYLVILIGLFMGFGIDLYERKKPKVSLNTDATEYSEVKLSNKNFTYAFRLEDKSGLRMEDESKVYQEVGYIHYRIENGTWSHKFEKRLPNKRCFELPYTREKEEYYNISLQGWNCIDFDNITLGGNWDGNFVYGLVIYTKQCTNDTIRKCSSKEDIKKFISLDDEPTALFYSDLSLEVYPRMQEYNSPLKTDFVNRYEILNLGLYKRKVQTYKTTNMVNDVGWFFPETKNEESIISSDFVLSDFTFKSSWTIDVLYTQIIYLGRKVDTYNRSYIKIQEVFASIGGFSRIFYFLINCLYRYIAETKRSLYLVSNISFENEQNDSKNNNLNDVNSLSLNNRSSFIKLDIPYDEHSENKVFKKPENEIVKKKKLPLKTDSFYNSKSSLKMVQLDFDNFNTNSINKNIKLEENFNSILIKNSIQRYRNSNNDIDNNLNVPNNTIIKNNLNQKLPRRSTSGRSINKFVNNQVDASNHSVNFIDLIKNKVCCIKSKRQENFYKIDNFSECKQYLKKNLDILTYLKILNEFKNLKKLLLDKSERQALKSKKPIIKNKLNISSKNFSLKKGSTSNLDSKLGVHSLQENINMNLPGDLEIK
jgi:hypothetical protein